MLSHSYVSLLPIVSCAAAFVKVINKAGKEYRKAVTGKVTPPPSIADVLSLPSAPPAKDAVAAAGAAAAGAAHDDALWNADETDPPVPQPPLPPSPVPRQIAQPVASSSSAPPPSTPPASSSSSAAVASPQPVLASPGFDPSVFIDDEAGRAGPAGDHEDE